MSKNNNQQGLLIGGGIFLVIIVASISFILINSDTNDDSNNSNNDDNNSSISSEPADTTNQGEQDLSVPTDDITPPSIPNPTDDIVENPSNDTNTGDTENTPTDQNQAVVSADYADGTYTATGDYTTPGGPHTIEVELTIADNQVTDVNVTAVDVENRTSTRYLEVFNDGISGEVEGKELDEIRVSEINRSSLTSIGFNDAVNKIKDQAS